MHTSIRRPLSASPRITARDENRLRHIEDKIVELGLAVAFGCTDRALVAERLRAALITADFYAVRGDDEEVLA
jgi:hypothetical protein